MENNLRIWRVEPTYKGVQAPTFFVETTLPFLHEAQREALKQAREKSSLSKFEEWNFILAKQAFRKDKFGRYFKYHQ